MKRFLSSILLAAIIVGCSSSNSTDKASSIIKEFLVDQISNPDTYQSVKTEIVSKGTIDVMDTKYWKNVPASGIIDVVILHHEFKNENRNNTLTENAFFFYMSPSMDVVYYAHADTGDGPLFSLD